MRIRVRRSRDLSISGADTGVPEHSKANDRRYQRYDLQRPSACKLPLAGNDFACWDCHLDRDSAGGWGREESEGVLEGR